MVVPGIFPSLSVDLNWRRHSAHLKKFGDTRGEKMLRKALKIKKMQGDTSPLVLPRNIRVISGLNGEYVMPLTDEVLRPKGKDFIIDDNYAPGYFSVDIDYKEPVVEPQPLDKNETLRAYHYFTKNLVVIRMF